MDADATRLSARAKEICEDNTNTLILSVASAWEMQIKHQIGKLRLRVSFREIIMHQHNTNGIQILPITLPHVLALDSLPHHHRDPFDRIIVAQANIENSRILSHDPILSKYTDRIIW